MPSRPLPPPLPSGARRRLLVAGTAAAVLGAPGGAAGAARAACRGWPLWQVFVERFVQVDGRVIDDQHQTRYTTSEGQAYALFFSLVAGDRPRFEKLLGWTASHLAGGSLEARLPGWQWGRRDDGDWTLLDANPAADADAWLAHTLFEAARHWHEPAYERTARSLLRRIAAAEVAVLPGAGAMLLPAPAGFVLPGEVWRLNPSYLALHQLRAFAARDPAGPWAAIATHTLALLAAAAPHGFAPDWVDYSAARGWHASAASPAIGSYDAVRCYLWAGLAHAADPLRPALLRQLRGMRAHVAGHGAAALPPRQIRTDTGEATADPTPAPSAFAAALLPYLAATGDIAAARRLAARVGRAVDADCAAAATGSGAAPSYYDVALALFGLGALERRYAFDRDGSLRLPPRR